MKEIKKSWKPKKIIKARKIFNQCVSSWRGFAEGFPRVVLIMVLCFSWSVKNMAQKIFSSLFDRNFYVKIVLTMIATNLVTKFSFNCRCFVDTKFKNFITWFFCYCYYSVTSLCSVRRCPRKIFFFLFCFYSGSLKMFHWKSFRFQYPKSKLYRGLEWICPICSNLRIWSKISVNKKSLCTPYLKDNLILIIFY